MTIKNIKQWKIYQIIPFQLALNVDFELVSQILFEEKAPCHQKKNRWRLELGGLVTQHYCHEKVKTGPAQQEFEWWVEGGA